MKQEAAETIALRLLAFVTDEGDRAMAFLAASGLAPADLAARAGDPTVLAGVVDFVLQDDALVIAAAAAVDLRPEQMAAVRRALPGGLVTDWS
jgi:hypothetical protein